MTSQRCSFSSPTTLAGHNGSTSGPCKCCPYGFHIDTDFVRYCDALLTALYGNNRSLTNTTCRSFGSLRRKLNLAFASPELFTSPTSKSFLPFCDYNSKNNHSQSYHLTQSCFETNGSHHFSPKEHHSYVRGPNRHRATNHFHSTASIETDYSATACEAESMLTEAVSKFEEVLLESKSSSKSTLYTSNVNDLGAHESPPLSPAPSSCPSSSISRSVLTQIRNHLALSLTRVKELENQVEQIPFLKEQINQLQAKLDGQRSRGAHEECFDANGNFIRQRVPHSSDIFGQIEQGPSSAASEVNKLAMPPRRLSFTKCESISLTSSGDKSNDIETRSIGTLTSFAPSLPPKNAFVQTELKSRDVVTRAESTSRATCTGDLVAKQMASCQAAPQMKHISTDSTDLSNLIQIKAANEDISPIQPVSVQDASVQVSLQSEVPKLLLDKSVSTTELSTSAARPTSLDLLSDSPNQWLYPEKTTLSSFNCSSPSSSNQSIRLCDKCHQMVNSITSDNLCSQDIAAFSLPKIIKSDSGISVERRQVDKAIEDSDNLMLVFPDLEMSSSMYTQFSEDHDNADQKHRVRLERKPLDYDSVQPSAEVKAAIKVIHENLTEPKKSSSFLFSKSVSYVKKVWFKVSSSEDSDSRIVELYLDCFEKFSTQLLDFMVNLSDSNGNTCIHYSISFQNFDVVSVLLDSKVCDVNKYNKAGYTATMLVSLVQIENDIYRDVVDRLFHQADVNMKAKQNGQTALMLSAAHGRLEMCSMLLDCGAEVNLQDNDGSTALMCAAEHGHPNVISLLLAHPDCDPLLEDNEGSSALKIALINGHNDVGILLYTGTRISNSYYASSCYSSLNRLPNSPIYSGHMRRAGSFSYNPGSSSHNASAHSLSLRTSPPRNRHYSMSTPSSPSRS